MTYFIIYRSTSCIRISLKSFLFWSSSSFFKIFFDKSIYFHSSFTWLYHFSYFFMYIIYDLSCLSHFLIFFFFFIYFFLFFLLLIFYFLYFLYFSIFLF